MSSIRQSNQRCPNTL